ncbi:MAG: hypothetical protein ACI8T1_005062, partial [Verrucomicrobiales bacterium]
GDAWQVISTAPVAAAGLSTAFTDSDTERTSAGLGFYRARVSN